MHKAIEGARSEAVGALVQVGARARVRIAKSVLQRDGRSEQGRV